MPCRFSLNTSERTYYFSAATFKEMEAWIRAFESWIGVDNNVTRARAPTADLDDHAPNAAPLQHLCPSCGKSYTSIEDLSTHIVLRHPGEPVPLPQGTGMQDRKVCQQCGKWYQLERDLLLHVQKRHGGGGASDGSATMEFGGASTGELPPMRRIASSSSNTADTSENLSALDLPDISTLIKKPTPQQQQYGLLSNVRASSGSPQPLPRSGAKARQEAEQQEKEEDWGEIDDIMGGLDDL
jgi:hypothetical protein